MDIFKNLNREEMDALLVTIYKRGIEKALESLNNQLDGMLKKRNRQRYLYLGEGYKAWLYWLLPE